MMQRIVWLSGLAVLLAVAVLPALTSAAEPNQAGLVVQFGDGQVETRCISFEEDEISGAELLARSGMEVIMDASGGMGITICQIEDVGCAHPAEPCFCQCMSGAECAYWNYFYRDSTQGEWTYSALGAALRKVKSGSVEAWVWGDGRTPPANELALEAICTPPAATPTAMLEPPTPLPVTSTIALTGTPRPSQSPIALPTATASRATFTPSPSPTTHTSQNLLSYWPFGIVVLGLALIGALAWLRGT
jgi:hypothetical protein